MPTRPGADLVPVRKATKERLLALKGERTFDDAIRDLLEAGSRMRPLGRERSPDEQVALAQLAARRWADALAKGRIEEKGERLLVLRLRKPARRTLDVSWSGRRGFDP